MSPAERYEQLGWEYEAEAGAEAFSIATVFKPPCATVAANEQFRDWCGDWYEVAHGEFIWDCDDELTDAGMCVRVYLPNLEWSEVDAHVQHVLALMAFEVAFFCPYSVYRTAFILWLAELSDAIEKAASVRYYVPHEDEVY